MALGHAIVVVSTRLNKNDTGYTCKFHSSADTQQWLCESRFLTARLV